MENDENGIIELNEWNNNNHNNNNNNNHNRISEERLKGERKLSAIPGSELHYTPKLDAKNKGATTKVVNAKEKKIKVRTGECSWCKETVDQLRITKHLRPRRSKYQCSHCYRTTITCRVPDCKRFARAHRGWKEAVCQHHHKFYKNEVQTGHCSWCFKETTHCLHMDNILNKVGMDRIFYCDGCHRATKKCRKCKINFARLGGTSSTGKCFVCAEVVPSWDDPEENMRLITKV
jgi:hypothetical protein